MKHELMPVPISLAETNGELRTGQKSLLADVLTNGIECPNEIKCQEDACLLIDGQALVSSLKCPTGDTATFGDFACNFLEAVLNTSTQYQEIHVVFDRYREDSIKGGTRRRRTKTTRPI